MSDNVNKKPVKRRWLIAAAVIVLIAAVIAVNVKQKTAGSENSVTEAEVTRMTIEKTLGSDGEIESALEENVKPHTSYYLDEINVEEGEAVEEGTAILTYTNGYTMDAPYNCVVKSWSLPDEDDQITSDHYVTIAGTDVLQMELSVSDSEVLELTEGDSAAVTVEATGATYQAEVSYISQSGEYSGGSSTFTARVTFDNDGSLKLGMSGSAVVSLEKAENVLAVPSDAISKKGGSSYVTVSSDGEETQTEVETGISNGTFTEIKSGLNEGDKVIVRTADNSSDMFGNDMMGGPGGDMGGGMPDGGNGGGGPQGSGERPEGSGQHHEQ